MQTPPPEHARFLHAWVGGVLLTGLVLALSGCDQSGAPNPRFAPADSAPPSAVSRDSALALLAAMRRTPFDSAFVALGRYTVTRQLRTERFDTTGAVAARRSYTLRYPPGAEKATLVSEDSSGALQQGGVLADLAPDSSPRSRPPDLAAEVLPDQPPYLAPRTQEDFRFAVHADTVDEGRPVRIVTVQARPDTGRDQSIRHARLTLTRDTHTLIELRVVRASRGILFREDSRLLIELKRAPDDAAWVPRRTRFRMRIDIPFRAPQHFRTVSTYTDYQT